MEPGPLDDSPERPRRSILTLIVAIVAGLVLVAGALVVALDDTDPPAEVEEADLVPPATELPPGDPEVPTEPLTPADLDAVVAELSAFVAEARELDFRERVTATLLDDAAFSARVQEEAIEDLVELEEAEGVFRALGLLDPGADLAESLRSLLGAGVVGFYDPENGDLVVRGTAITPYVRLTLVHELTHALEDQHFDLDRPGLEDADDESAFAFGALTEGSALRVEDLYRDTLSDSERDAAADEESRLASGIDVSSIPRVLPQIIGFPYVFGPAMVGELDEEGGNERIDAAFVDPPVTSEQILDPDSWLSGDAEPVSVDPPAADGEVFDEGTLGQWGLYILLSESVGDRGATEAAGGWGGDWYVAWRQGDEVCVRATIVMDTREDLRELAGALDEWAAAQPAAEVARGDDDVSLESCA